MDHLNKTVRNFKKSKNKEEDLPPAYDTVAPSTPQQPLPKQNSLDQKPARQPPAQESTSTSRNPKSKMPKADFSGDERRPRKGNPYGDPESDGSDMEDMRKSKQLVKRGKQRAASDYDDSGAEDMRKSKQLVKRGKKDKSSKKRRDDSDSEEEMIVTKTARKKVLDITEIDPEFLNLLMEAFGVRRSKIESWIDKDWIKWDNKTNEYDISKILDKNDDDDGGIKFFNKEYKKHKDRWQMPREDAAGSSHPRRGGRPVIIVDDGFNPSYDSLCVVCYMRGRYCGNPYHDE